MSLFQLKNAHRLLFFKQVLCVLLLTTASEAFCASPHQIKLPYNTSDTLSSSHSEHSYLKDLEELGYCVIPQILSTAETKTLYERVWHEYVEKAWPSCKMDDSSNWKETFPMHNPHGVFSGPAGQIQVLWDLRQDPRIVDIFARIWNTEDLIVSMDGLSIMCPSEIREGCVTAWPHVDQNHDTTHDFVSESLLATKPYTIQGQFLLEDSFEGDGGFYCIPKSHLRFGEFAPELTAINAEDIPKEEKRNRSNRFIHDFFGLDQEQCETHYYKKQITAPRGSLILWDSRTIHWNQHAQKERPHNTFPKVRMVAYLCYVPKSRLTDEGAVLRKKAFEMGIATCHDPANVTVRTSADYIQVHPYYKHYLEDENYKLPQVKLTSLGESLLGISRH